MVRAFGVPIIFMGILLKVGSMLRVKFWFTIYNDGVLLIL